MPWGLSASVGRHGVLQPILIRVDESGKAEDRAKLYVAAEERRVEAAGRKTNQRRTREKGHRRPQAFFALMDKALGKFHSLDTTEWTDDNEENLRIYLGNLREEIEGILQSRDSQSLA